MRIKQCMRCGQLHPITEFYAHKAMADGTLNKCKCCCRSEAIANRAMKVDYYRQYDVMRAATPERKLKLAERQRRYRSLNAEKNAARAAVNRAILAGKLTRMPCEVCGRQGTDAHHDDYSKPLSVRWLCRTHHLIEHGRYVVPEKQSPGGEA